MTAKKAEQNKLELPKAWQMFQLISIQTFAGALVAYIILMTDSVSKAITNGFGAKVYAVILATFLVIGVISGFFGGTKALLLLIQTMKQIKVKDE